VGRLLTSPSGSKTRVSSASAPIGVTAISPVSLICLRFLPSERSGPGLGLLPALFQAITPALAVQAGARPLTAVLASALRAACDGCERGVRRLRRRQHRLRDAQEPAMKSTIGRHRMLTDAQVQIVLASHARYLAWKALRNTFKSQRELAREFGVSQGTISRAVRVKGEYKRPPRE